MVAINLRGFKIDVDRVILGLHFDESFRPTIENADVFRLVFLAFAP